MSRIGPYPMHVGIENVMTPQSEVGRANLPQSLRVLPSDQMAQAVMEASLPPTLKEQMARFLEPNIAARELLVPDVLFAVLSRNRDELKRDGRGGGNRRRKAAELLEELLEDKQLCDMLRRLLVSG